MKMVLTRNRDGNSNTVQSRGETRKGTLTTATISARGAQMRRRPLRTACLAAAVLAVMPPVIESQTSVINSTCYTTIQSINTAMTTELALIASGEAAKPSYTYKLCPFTFFDATTAPLEPVLDNTLFICGENGNPSDGCVITGGNQQVIITDSKIADYPIEQINFIGITFAGFETSSNSTTTGTSIVASASSKTTATFTDVTWQEFLSDFVIRQVGVDNSTEPMSIEIKGASVIGGTAGAVFDNDRGLLRINSLQVKDVKAASLIATANTGSSFLEDSTIEGSEMDSITYTTAGATQTVRNTAVTNMKFIEDAFFVEDESSLLTITNLILEQNTEIQTPWSVVNARSKSIANITGSLISDNKLIEFGFLAFDSSISISQSQLRLNSGTESLNTTSAPVFGITDAVIQMDKVILDGNLDFSGQIIALIRSRLVINNSCFQNGNSEFVVFVANDASYQQSENFIENFTSDQCPATGPRLFKESQDSGCFLGSSICEGDCLELADQVSCRASVVTTAPTTAPTAVTSTAITTAATTADTITPTNATQPSLSPTAVSTVSPTQVSPGSSEIPTIPPSKTSKPTKTKVPTLAPTITTSPITPSDQPTQISSDVGTIPPTAVNSFDVSDEKSFSQKKKCKSIKSRSSSNSKGKGEAKSIISKNITNISYISKGKGTDSGKSTETKSPIAENITNGSDSSKGKGKNSGKGTGSSSSKYDDYSCEEDEESPDASKGGRGSSRVKKGKKYWNDEKTVSKGSKLEGKSKGGKWNKSWISLLKHIHESKDDGNTGNNSMSDNSRIPWAPIPIANGVIGNSSISNNFSFHYDILPTANTVPDGNSITSNSSSTSTSTNFSN